MSTRDELVAAIVERYGRSNRAERSQILNEFVAVTGFHRKHAARLLGGGQQSRRVGPRPNRRIYDDAVREALIVLWEASDRICGKRLKPLIPTLVEAMERHGHLRLVPEVRAALLSISAATIDRALREIRVAAGGRSRRRTAPSAAIRRSVPIRTFTDWLDPSPGFFEADLVTHSGPRVSGSFICTLVLTDIATGWTECAPLLVREQKLLTEVLTELRKLMPMPLLGFDTDNDAVFMNETVHEYCRAEGIAFTRCRPYRKNDQAWVEQKNGAVVRRIVGYRRFEGLEAAAALARLYATVRLFVNFFQPSFKLAEKARDGAKVKNRLPHRPNDCWQIHASRSSSRSRRVPFTLCWIRWRCCVKCVRPSSTWWRSPTRTWPMIASQPRRHSSSSSPGCARRGGRAKSDQQPAPIQNPYACAVDRIHLRQLMVSCANASRPSHGGRPGSYSSVCSRNTQASIRTSYCGRCSGG
jgi:hypothetical protein